MGTNKIQEIPPQRCDPGDVLAYDLHTDDDRKILSGGTELTEDQIRQIVGLNVSSVPIFKPDAPEINPDQSIPKASDPQTSNIEVKTSEDTPETRVEGNELIINDDLEQKFVSDRNVIVKGGLSSGANLIGRGDITIKGTVDDGFIRSVNGDILIENGVSGDDIELISADSVMVDSIRDCSLTVEGNLIIQEKIENTHLQCDGNLLLHEIENEAKIKNSDIQVKGKMLADNVDIGDENSELYFKNPERLKLRDQKQEYLEGLEKTQSEIDKLEKVANAAKELDTNIKSLSGDKKEKIKDYLDKYRKRKDQEEDLKLKLNSVEENLNELERQRYYFLRILSEVKEGTEINIFDDQLSLRNSERNVRFYRKGSIRIQNAKDNDFTEFPWANAILQELMNDES